MQQEVRDGYRLSTQDINAAIGANLARYAPVGDAWELAGFPLNFYADDIYHAQNRGTLLNALVLYQTIYDDPTTSDIPLSSLLVNLRTIRPRRSTIDFAGRRDACSRTRIANHCGHCDAHHCRATQPAYLLWLALVVKFRGSSLFCHGASCTRKKDQNTSSGAPNRRNAPTQRSTGVCIRRRSVKYGG